MNTRQFERVFPLGSHLCREPMPAMTELKRDMENLKRHGFNLDPANRDAAAANLAAREFLLRRLAS